MTNFCINIEVSVWYFSLLIMDVLELHRAEYNRLASLSLEERLQFFRQIDINHVEKYGFERDKSQDVYALFLHKMQDGMTDEGVDVAVQRDIVAVKLGYDVIKNCIPTLKIDLEIKPFNLQVKQLVQHLGYAVERRDGDVANILRIIIKSMQNKNPEAYSMYEIIDEIPRTLSNIDARKICNILRRIFK